LGLIGHRLNIIIFYKVEHRLNIIILLDVVGILNTVSCSIMNYGNEYELTDS
jgi:hypothetical protein